MRLTGIFDARTFDITHIVDLIECFVTGRQLPEPFLCKVTSAQGSKIILDPVEVISLTYQKELDVVSGSNSLDTLFCY